MESVEPVASVTEIVKLMQQFDIAFVPVVNEGMAIGVVIDRDLALKCLNDHMSPSSIHAEDVMTPTLYAVQMDADPEEAAWMMVNDCFRRLLLLNALLTPLGGDLH